MRKEGYYLIKVNGFHEWVVGYWYNSEESLGFFDCSNHWHFLDSGYVFEKDVIVVNEKVDLSQYLRTEE